MVSLSVGYYIQLIVTFVLAIGGMIFLMRWTKKVRLTKFSGDLSIEDRLAVDQKATVMVVKYKEARYLLSVGGTEIKVIEKL